MSDLIILYCAVSFLFALGVIIERELWKNLDQILASVFILIFSPLVVPMSLGSVSWKRLS